jgi:hypothetical protein
MFIIRVIRIILTLILGAIYWPLNTVYLRIQKWYFGMKTKDIIVWYAFTPFYWILVVIVTIISVPYEAIANGLH